MSQAADESRGSSSSGYLTATLGLAQPTSSAVGETTAGIQYFGSIYIYPGHDADDNDYTYSNLYYSISWGNGSTDSIGLSMGSWSNMIDGSKAILYGSGGEDLIVTGLSKGSANSITLTLSVTCRENETNRSLSYQTSASLESYVYTKPGSFINDGGGWTVQQGHTIQDANSGLSGLWTEKWAAHMNKIIQWYNQSGGITTANSTIRQSGDLITADWYNSCVNLINTYTSSFSPINGVTQNETVISADIINLLATKNSTS